MLWKKQPLPPMDAKMKHLEFIQNVIARMSTNSFLFKGWTITIAAGLGAFAAVELRAGILVLALGTTALFWGLDGYYLWLERCFRNLHRAVMATPPDKIDFAMEPPKPRRRRRLWQWLGTCFRFHLLMFYGVIIAVDLIGIHFIGGK